MQAPRFSAFFDIYSSSFNRLASTVGHEEATRIRENARQAVQDGLGHYSDDAIVIEIILNNHRAAAGKDRLRRFDKSDVDVAHIVLRTPEGRHLTPRIPRPKRWSWERYIDHLIQRVQKLARKHNLPVLPPDQQPGRPQNPYYRF